MQQNNSTNVHFASRLQQLLSEKGMSKSQLADIVGVSPTAIGNYCSGRIPRADELHRISRAFGVTMEEMLTGERSKRAEPAAGVWKVKAEHAEQKLAAVKSALSGLLKKI